MTRDGTDVVTENLTAAPARYLSQGERALERGTHYIEESIWVYLMRLLADSLGYTLSTR
ncbi:hypothetical protein R1X32_07470 (plasmid) [Rhodococcus opacus]|uniref:hypothetical protein n=1 Tax=Rhodococcus opacus TaxID=37919 RepID=UPI0034D31081